MFGKSFCAAIALAFLSACTTANRESVANMSVSETESEPTVQADASGREELEPLISHYAEKYEIPESLLHRVVTRESRYNPQARNGPYWGLMQVRHDTAQSMGYQGPASGLLDPSTNLEYAGRYLRGAWLLADGSESRAVGLYASGYYYVAKKRGMLCETGLRNC
ncbi:lytic transglycosylase domain-containing protein [Notoacmeibacter ruber]|uniref:Lytic transglycosylase domain-containing protein n=1 Tax=Notoacmeibacter ruber TaxID=2670375 RepID=A0A3L7JBR5_9HYPH|nr:lytic transglycosylase domain-containing protein [Notoacmeibacter ruber]RLQ88198.1 lytic transglycosylase domain-containing protein [Notoacmeibacter ruber]